MDKKTNGQTDKWTNRQMDRKNDRQMYKKYISYKFILNEHTKTKRKKKVHK